MLLILKADVDKNSQTYRRLWTHLENLKGIRASTHDTVGAQQRLTEIYLIGDTARLDPATLECFEVVERVIRISREYKILGRHQGDLRAHAFTYNGVNFSQDNLHVFAGLCAVDTREHVELMMRALQAAGEVCTRMGAYKPRTSPYSFQGHGSRCLPYVFELAGKYGIKVIAIEVTHESHIDDIRKVLEQTGHPTGAMLQVGTRNTQNFELLKCIGRQTDFPILFKRGFGITLNESLNAAEYLAHEGNSRVVFCLRGIKSSMGDPHRNLVDFAHVPVIKRFTRMPVCVDPSHSVGTREGSPDGIPDVFHAAAQGVVSGANMVLVDFHPKPQLALVDGPQALLLEELSWFLEDMRIAHEAYQQRRRLVPSADEMPAAGSN